MSISGYNVCAVHLHEYDWMTTEPINEAVIENHPISQCEQDFSALLELRLSSIPVTAAQCVRTCLHNNLSRLCRDT